jgi:hypothetical protein
MLDPPKLLGAVQLTVSCAFVVLYGVFAGTELVTNVGTLEAVIGVRYGLSDQYAVGESANTAAV